jgi:hypothetical protein
VRRVRAREVDGVSTFASALATDRVIAAIRAADGDAPRPVVTAPDDATPGLTTSDAVTPTRPRPRRAVAHLRAGVVSARRAVQRATTNRRSA